MCIRDRDKTGTITEPQAIIHYNKMNDISETKNMIYAIQSNYEIFNLSPIPVSYTHLDVYKRQVLASLEIIAEEIEDPFSGDENDLPTKRLAENIDLQCSEILCPDNANLKLKAKS